MRITSFRIENFRNLQLAECSNPPDFMVICGGNGSGKSAVLNALMSAKEYAGGYGSFSFDPRAVSADSDMAVISLNLSFNDIEREFVQKTFNTSIAEQDEIVIEIRKGGNATVRKRSQAAMHLLSWYSRPYFNSPGFFDYIDAYRPVPKLQLSKWDASVLSDQNAKNTLGATGDAKFRNTKSYLAGLVMQDIQHAQASHRAGAMEHKDSLKPIKDFFDGFFKPLRFVDVLIHEAPFQFIIETPRGIIDLDDMSSGEKEVLNTFIRFHQLNPRGAVILFDEADAHLHPDLERRYLEVLRDIGKGNQLWLTSHSPEMMIAAGTESLYTVLKEPTSTNGNQFSRVTSNEELHAALSELMGSRGLVSFNQRIVFIEGEESSADREVYEKLYPSSQYQVSFVPAGNSASVRKTAERVNELLSSSIEFQQYYSIVDGDLERSVPASAQASARLFQLPVYHVENFLIREDLVLSAARDMLGSKCPYSSLSEVEAALVDIVLSPQHIKPYAKALQDSRLAGAAKEAWDSVFKQQAHTTQTVPSFSQTEADALTMMNQAVADKTWRDKCKGREVLKAFSGRNGLAYEHFRNVLISKLASPPPSLADIMARVFS
jgi:predicted ATPase